jgi:S-adenosylmethionine-diacylgycerolhomoserine-N-methlytransferase
LPPGNFLNMVATPSGGHSQLMDRVYRRQRHIYDLTRKYYLFGRDKVIRDLGLRPGAKLVEIGCGTARNLIEIARRYPDVRLYGLDASAEMLRTAEESVKRAGIGACVLRQGYAEALDGLTFGQESAPFDHALFSYSLSMIPDWQGALAAAASVVKPEGSIDIVDFGDLAGLGPIAESALLSWLRLFHVKPRAELLQAIEPVARDLGGGLWVAPGRYAFAWRCSPADLVRLRLTSVAEWSQSLTKP